MSATKSSTAREGRDPEPSAGLIDSQSVKGADTVGRNSRGYDAGTLDLRTRMSGQTTDELAARRALIEPLTERERTILRYLTSALSSAEIATELYLSVNTVKTHQRTVYRKLGVQGRREAARRPAPFVWSKHRER
jgi:DNA-binding CsgD family transcriptional regulator